MVPLVDMIDMPLGGERTALPRRKPETKYLPMASISVRLLASTSSTFFSSFPQASRSAFPGVHLSIRPGVQSLDELKCTHLVWRVDSLAHMLAIEALTSPEIIRPTRALTFHGCA